MILGALDLSGLDRAGEMAAVDARSILMALLGGDAESAWSAISGMLESIWLQWTEELPGIGAALIVPVVAAFLLRILMADSDGALRAAGFVCRAAVISVLARLFVELRLDAQAHMDRLLACSEALLPTLMAATAISGAEMTAAALTPFAGICAEVIQQLLGKVGMTLGACAAAVAIAGNLSRSIRLGRLHALFRRLLYWMAGAAMAALMGGLSIQGRLSAGRDTLAARTAHYALESVIPVIGGDVSSSLDSLLSTAGVVRSAIGVSGLVLLVGVSVAPLGKIIGYALMLRFFSAVSEPMGDEAITVMTAQLADAVDMLLVVCVAALVICGMLSGSCIAAVSGIVR